MNYSLNSLKKCLKCTNLLKFTCREKIKSIRFLKLLGFSSIYSFYIMRKELCDNILMIKIDYD